MTPFMHPEVKNPSKLQLQLQLSKYYCKVLESVPYSIVVEKVGFKFRLLRVVCSHAATILPRRFHVCSHPSLVWWMVVVKKVKGINMCFFRVVSIFLLVEEFASYSSMNINIVLKLLLDKNNCMATASTACDVSCLTRFRSTGGRQKQATVVQTVRCS